MSKKSLSSITRLTAEEKQLKKSSFESMYQSAIKQSEKGLFAEMYDSYEAEEDHHRMKHAPNHLPSGDQVKHEDGESYSDEDLEALGLKDAKPDAEDGEHVEVTPEEQSKFDKMFAVAMSGFDAKKSDKEDEESFDDKMKALEDKALLSKMKEEDAEECSDDEESEYDHCDHCTAEDAECEHCGEEEDHDDEDVVEENVFDTLWNKVNDERLHEEGKRKPMSVGAILGAAEQGEKVGPDGKAIPNEDAECDHEDAEECDKHEDKTHTPDDLYGKEDAAYDMKSSEIKEDEEDHDEEDKEEDVVEEGTMSYMSQVQKVDQMMDAPEAPVALVEESAVVEVKPSEREVYTEEKITVESYAGGFAKTLK